MRCGGDNRRESKIHIEIGQDAGFWAAMWPALIGAVVGGAATLGGVTLEQRGQARLRRSEARSEVEGYLRAVRTEVDMLWKLYLAEVGNDLAALDDGKAFRHEWAASHDYFAIYLGNTSLLASVPDDQLRTLIVYTYMSAMGLVDSFSTNSQVIREDAERAEQMMGHTGGLAIFVEYQAPLYARQLKAQHFRVGEAASQLIDMIDSMLPPAAPAPGTAPPLGRSSR